MAHVLVVGGSSGIGHAIARAAAKNPHNEVVVACRHEPEGNTLWSWSELDLRWPVARMADALALAVKLFPKPHRIDWLVLCGGTAGYQRPLYADALRGKMLEHEQVARETVATNLTGTLLLLEAAFPHLRRRGSVRSRVLLVGSTIHRHRPPHDLLFYTAAKAGAQAGIRAVARGLAHHGILANVLEPGWVRTPMTHAIIPEKREKIEKATALGRMAEPDEIAEVALSILSGPEYFCGDVITCSGGVGV